MTRRVTLSERRELLKRYSDDEDEPPEDVLAKFEATGRLPRDEDAEFNKTAPEPPGRKWAKYRKHLRLMGAITLGVFETAIAVMFTFYVELGGDWHRAALAAETFIIVSAIFVGIEARHRKKLPSVRRGLKLGAILFIYNAVIVPFASYFVGAFSKGAISDDPALMASGLLYLIVGGVITLACLHHYRKAMTEPENAPPLSLRPLWSFLRRPRAVGRRYGQEDAKSQTERPEVIDVNFKPVREWHMPSISNLLIGDDRRHASLIMMGRCAAAMITIYLFGIRYGYVQSDGSVPPGGDQAYYAVIGTVIVLGIGILHFCSQATGRFDGRLLRRAAAQIVIAFAIFQIGQQVIRHVDGLPYYADDIVRYAAFFTFVSGCTKFVRLPWSFWK